MKQEKDEVKSSTEGFELTYSDNPKTHFFYEYEGECSVDPLRMIEDGVFLWHEQMLNISERDISRLWSYAEDLLTARHTPAVYSYIEWLRNKITLGIIVPEAWDRRRPYPYKWMLISAIYFQEARRLCKEGHIDRAWHVATMAYYNLGMSTNPTLTQSVSKAASMKHSKANWKLRALVLGVLDHVKKENTASSINEAKNKIVEFVNESPEGRAILRAFHAETSEGSCRESEYGELGQLENLLATWAGYKSPYQEIRDAFMYFKRGGQKKEDVSYQSTSEDIPANKLHDGVEGYIRIVNYMDKAGGILTTEITRNDEGSEEQQAG